jgi:hypothetical protein
MNRENNGKWKITIKMTKKRDKFTTVRRKKEKRKKASVGLNIYCLHTASVRFLRSIVTLRPKLTSPPDLTVNQPYGPREHAVSLRESSLAWVNHRRMNLRPQQQHWATPVPHQHSTTVHDAASQGNQMSTLRRTAVPSSPQVWTSASTVQSDCALHKDLQGQKPGCWHCLIFQTKIPFYCHLNTLRTELLNCLNARSRSLTFRHRASCI